MRVLHNVRPEESLICRGTHKYYSAGEPTGDLESWLVTRLPDGTEIVRSDINGTNGSGGNLVSHLRRSNTGKPEWLRVRYRREGINGAAQYTFEDAAIRIARQVEGCQRRIDLLEIAANYAVDYHSVIGHDYVWRGYPADAEGEGRSIPIFSLDLWTIDENILAGRALRFFIKPLGSVSCPTSIGEFSEADHYAITYNDGVEALVWYDQQGIPLRWSYPESGYDFDLVSYQSKQ